MKKINRKYIWIAILLFVIACSTVPITGRKQIKLVPDGQMTAMAATSYNDFLNENRGKVINNGAQYEMVNRVGRNISVSVENYLRNNGLGNTIKNYQWEFNLINDNVANAWAMPGGKVVFYTGILPITQTETGLAVVMGHEIAHAVANHGSERYSQSMMASGLMTLADILLYNEKNPNASRELLLQAVGFSTQLGLLKFSRTHESEADKMGLIFMAMAGYNPEETVAFWQRMAQLSGGAAPPQFLSTHPSNETRINDLRAYLPEAMKYYNPLGK